MTKGRYLHSLLWLGAAILGGWLVLRRRQPVILQVPVVKPGEPLRVIGRNLRSERKSGRLWLQIGSRSVELDRLESWTKSQIVAALSPELCESMVGETPHVVVQVTGRRRSNVMPLTIQASQVQSEPFAYQVPVQADAPWPTFRRDHRNSGCSPLPARHEGDRPWSFQTGKGIFSTPVIDGRGIIYIGSADHNFYAIAPDGHELWRCRTGELIDSAAALLPDQLVGSRAVVFPSGDGHLRCLRCTDGSVIWSLDARESLQAGFNNWFEGNVAVGYDGTLYAGNTNFSYYAISPAGRLKWTYATGANAWSNAAFGPDGTIYWASNDTIIRAVRPDGVERWRRRTLGMLAASAAVGSDGTIYIGSFDSYLRALDPTTGRVRWRFKTGDHIYGSTALGQNMDGHTTAIYIGSADGILYALAPDGRLLWTYDCGAPIRSSPAVGRAPDGEGGEIIYFGCGNGQLYALDAATGWRRWSYDTTPADPELADRNDLNGSPALSRTGVVIGGEHGQVWYVPYDYPLHAPDDPRGNTSPAEDLPADMTGLCYVSPGGNTRHDGIPVLSPATLITLQLVVRRQGRTLDAHVYNAPYGRPRDALQIEVQPSFPFQVECSADGRFLHIIPESILAPDTEYTISAAGTFYTGGLSIGNLTLGGRKTGRFEQTLSFRTAPLDGEWPLACGDDQISALEWTRLAVPIPPMLPSLNQIGFDYMDWIIGAVHQKPGSVSGSGRCVLWAIGGKRNADGVLVADPNSDFTLPFGGRYRGNAFILDNHRFTMQVTGIPIPFDLFEMRGQMNADLRVRPGATARAITRILSIPTFGPLMVLAGLGNNWWEKLVAMATYITRPYPAEGSAHRRPAGVTVASFEYAPPSRRRPGRVTATFELADGASYPLAEHRPGILLLDPGRCQAVSLDYHANLRALGDEAGNLRSVALTIPAGTELPADLEAMVILDVFPLERFPL